MKKYLLLFIAVFLLIHCGVFEFLTRQYVTISGRIPPPYLDKRGAASPGDALTLSDAQKVLAFYGNHYSLSEIRNGSFSIGTPAGWATALAFLDSGNAFIGNLFCGGLNMLPLVGLIDGGQTAIDLSNLTLDGCSVIPEHDPLGNEIILDDEVLECLRITGAYFASLAANIDSDGDGIPDILNEKQVILTSRFVLEGGLYGTDTSDAVLYDSSRYRLGYSLRAEGGRNVAPDQGDIRLSGPQEDPYAQIDVWQQLYLAGGDFIASFKVGGYEDSSLSEGISSPYPFRFGTYTLTVGNLPGRTLYYSNMGVEPYLALAVPTLRTDADGKLTSIGLEYRLPDGTPVDPVQLLTDITFQFDSHEGRLFQLGELYDLTDAPSEVDFSEISVRPSRNIDGLCRVTVGYIDLVGNEYNVIWFDREP